MDNQILDNLQQPNFAEALLDYEDTHPNNPSNILEKKALTDSLTGLSNRWLWDEKIQEAANGDKPFAVLIIDIDHFKKINDACGHPTGDKFLVALANKIKALVRQDGESPDIAARYGGDELALLLKEIDLETAKMIAERLREDIEKEAIPFNGHQARTTISIGLTEGLGKTPEQIMEEADQALYQAKYKGRNRIEVWAPELESLRV